MKRGISVHNGKENERLQEVLLWTAMRLCATVWE